MLLTTTDASSSLRVGLATRLGIVSEHQLVSHSNPFCYFTSTSTYSRLFSSVPQVPARQKGNYAKGSSTRS